MIQLVSFFKKECFTNMLKDNPQIEHILGSSPQVFLSDKSKSSCSGFPSTWSSLSRSDLITQDYIGPLWAGSEMLHSVCSKSSPSPLFQLQFLIYSLLALQNCLLITYLNALHNLMTFASSSLRKFFEVFIVFYSPRAAFMMLNMKPSSSQTTYIDSLLLVRPSEDSELETLSIFPQKSPVKDSFFP